MPIPNPLIIGTLGVLSCALMGSCARGEPAASRATELAVTAPADGLTVAVEGPSVDVPWIISPLVRGDGGAQLQYTVHDEPHFLFRIGGGYAAVRSTGAAPPFQPPPARRWNLEGSALALRHDGGEFYASMQRRNWGPGWTGSLILDGASQPLAAVGWRRPQDRPSEHPWLRWMGPWSADVFFGRLFGHVEPNQPALIGMRLQLQPFENFQLGLSRALQWGGDGRQENLPSLLRGLAGWDNAGTRGITSDNQPGNQLGGFDWRLSFGPERQWAFYGQAIGEDENGYVPSALIVQAGFDSRIVVRGVELIGFIEWNDLIAGHAYGTKRPPGITYTSSVYPQGYTHDSMPLGHPAGGDVQLASAGVIARTGRVHVAAVASRGEALPTAQRFAPGVITGFNGSASVLIDAQQQIGAALWWWRDTAERQSAGQVWWRWLW
ncbi:MAG TPA: capsule assembly Wzi family protein [Burkholderiaceae bacterium]|nr:capsule assembly Wzi family protein [Burkholderiaceae bacterium]